MTPPSKWGRCSSPQKVQSNTNPCPDYGKNPKHVKLPQPASTRDIEIIDAIRFQHFTINRILMGVSIPIDKK
jgi:hypothetical protein